MFLSCFFLFILQTFGEEATVENITYTGTTSFANGYQVPFSYTMLTTSGDRDGNQVDLITNADNTYWVSKEEVTPENPAYIIITFAHPVTIKGFIMQFGYKTINNVRNWNGVPKILNVYASSDFEPFKLINIFNGPANFENIQFVLSQPIKCKQLKLEFVEVTIDEYISNLYCVCLRQLRLIGEQLKQDILPIPGITGDYANNDYISKHRIPNSIFTARTSGDNESQPLSNLFDNDRTTYWSSKEPNTEAFSNYLFLNFEKTVTFEGFLYYASYSTTGNTRYFHGFPTTLTVYKPLEDGSYQTVAVFSQKHTSKIDCFQFILPEPIEVNKLKIEFTQVTKDNYFTFKYCLCSGDIVLLQKLPDNFDEINTQIKELFVDYAQLILPETVTQEKLQELRDKAIKLTAYESVLKPLLDRAEAILSGILKKDPHREFSTKPGSTNQIYQYGDLVRYCRNEILHNSFGTNRQSIGIGGTTDKKITFYVKIEPFENVAKSSVKLPEVTFSQAWSSWQSSFRSGYKLKEGKNIFTFPNMKTQGYVQPIEAGGPIHISNPYTREQQGGDVTIYIEDGYLFPFFRLGDDEEAFKIILKNYYNRLMDPNDTEITINVWESVTDHLLLSGKCDGAYDIYINKNASPQRNAEKWDKWIESLLAFGGITFDPTDPSYDPRSEHILQNFRILQPNPNYGGLTYNEMIGFPGQGDSNFYDFQSCGWAFPHELGHAIDKPARTWGEVTNNMWAMADLFILNNNVFDRIPLSSVSRNLASDFSDYVTHKNGLYEMDSNPSSWWILEGGHPGYWAKSENLYIHEKSDFVNGNSILGKAERLIYYASLAIGQNASEYFDRIGYYMPGNTYDVNNRWSYEKSTDNFKNLISQAVSEGRITSTCYKYWYVDLDQYSMLYKHNYKLGEWAHIYNEDQFIKPTSINKVDGSYAIYLPAIENTEAHLCYEIQALVDGEWKVAGITTSEFFFDDHNYDGVEPQYKVYAYDRSFHHTGDCQENSPTISFEKICRIGDVYYDNLQSAVDNANDNDVILLCKSFGTSPVTIQKPLTIEPDENLQEPIIISRLSVGDLIHTQSPANTDIIIGSNSKVKIIFDGGSFKQSGTLIRCNHRKTTLTNVELRNNINSADGGAIWLEFQSKLLFDTSSITNCRAKNGGGIYVTGGSVFTELELNADTIKNCHADNLGGGIYGSAAGGMSVIKTITTAPTFEDCTAARGGAIYLIKRCELKSPRFIRNKATDKGGAIYLGNNYMKLDNPVFQDNEAPIGSTAFIELGKLIFNAGTYAGTICKSSKSTIEFQKWASTPATLPNFNNCKFNLDLQDGGVILIDVIPNVYQITDEYLQTIPVENGYATYENSKIMAYKKHSTLTIIASIQTYQLVVENGDFVFQSTFEGFSNDYYITSWSSDGVTYNIGDKININSNKEFQITIEPLMKVKLVYGQKEQIIGIVKYNKYYLPMTTPDDEVVHGWQCSNGNYYAYAEGVIISEDLTFTAVLKKKVILTIQIRTDTQKVELEYGEKYRLPQPPLTVDGLTFKYWEIGDTKYQPNTIITAENDMTITAFYSNLISLKFIAGESESAVDYKLDDVVQLHVAPPEYPDRPNAGREFIYWTNQNKNYYPYYKYSVKENIEFVAIYQMINKNDPITITFETPLVSDEYPYYTQGTQTKTETHHYLDNITLLSAEYFESLPHGLGYDPTTETKVVFDHWLINGIKYYGSDIVGVTQNFKAVLVTRITDITIPTEIPSISPSESELPTPQTETPTVELEITTNPIIDYSNLVLKDSIMSTVHIDDSFSTSEIKNSKFINCTSNDDDSEYIFVVKKEFHFDNVEFVLSKKGAIKIDCTNEVTISNCIFTDCSVKDGNGNAIHISLHEQSTKKVIENCAFNSCGKQGYAVLSDDLIEIKNSNVTSSDCGGYKIQKCGSSIINCHFSSLKSQEAIYYYHSSKIAELGEIFEIKKCTFENIDGIGCYFSIPTNSPDNLLIKESMFVNCINKAQSSDTNAIGIIEDADSISLSINNCAFRNCGTKGYAISLPLMRVKSDYTETLISFIEDTFEFDSKENACAALYIMHDFRKVLVKECIFRQCKPTQYNEEYVSSICISHLNEISIEKSKFFDCGSDSIDNYLIFVELDYVKCIVKNCTFDSKKEGHTTGRIISGFENNLVLIGNEFAKCNYESILIKPGSGIDEPFELIENHFIDCTTGKLLVSSENGGFGTNPVIKGNVFENIDISSELFIFSFDFYPCTLLFDSNTFKSVSTKYGGFGGKITITSTEENIAPELIFSSCLFINNKQSTQGGAFCSNEIQNDKNVVLNFSNCKFENNKAVSFGGALYIDSYQTITIENCDFVGNKAGDGQGAAIFINSDSDEKENMHSAIIKKCTFKDHSNYEADKNDGYAIQSSSYSLEITDSVIEYSNTDSSISGLLTESSTHSLTIQRCKFIKCSGFESTSFNINCHNSIIFEDNIIKSCEYQNNIGIITILNDDIIEQTVSNCEFIGNKKETEINMNTGLLIQKSSKENLKVIYNKCTFKENSVSSKSITLASLPHEIELQINRCQFLNNQASKDGGSLYISCISSVSITETNFTDNACKERGGAIFIDYATKKNDDDNKDNNDDSSSKLLDSVSYCSIKSCLFERNKAEIHGNTIYIDDKRKESSYSLTNNVFKDNYYDSNNIGYIIVSTNKVIEVSSNQFSNNDSNIEIKPFLNLEIIPPSGIIVEDQDLDSNRYDKVIDNSEVINVIIKVSSFTGIDHTDNGGAIHIVNAGLNCNEVEFESCNSNEAGGAIFLSYNYSYSNKVILEDLSFDNCKAKYGGAVYIYSSSLNNHVKISDCLFTNNIASSEKHGGSAIFITARIALLEENKFKDNQGESILKIYNNFESNQKHSSSLKLNNFDGVLVADCEFESNLQTKSCLFYTLGNDGSRCEINDCEFSGELSNEAHYIDGEVISNKGHKLVVKKCKFESESGRAVNLDQNNKFIEIDLDEQDFKQSDESKGDDEKKSSFSWKIIVAVAVPVVAVIIIVIVVIVVVRKKKIKSSDADFNNSGILDETEMSSKTFTIDDNNQQPNETELNLSLI